MAGNRGETLAAINHHWSIDFARFFNFPTITTTVEATSDSPHKLRPLPNAAKKRLKNGTWISSSSSPLRASVQLLTHETVAEIVLIVSCFNKVNEEHFISKLHFSWPQVSCNVKGSRVVFASYRDSENQLQKFAMRFSTPDDLQTFISCLKDNLGGVNKFGPSGHVLRTETACPPESISSDVYNYSADEELNNARLVGGYPTSHQPLLNYEGVLPNYNSQALRSMTNDSFYDMLSKIENKIDELGGDLSLGSY